MRKIIFALLGLTVSLVMASQSVAVCQQECALNYAKCLIANSDRQTCLGQEASCANGCQQTSEIENVECSTRCVRCQKAANKIEDEIREHGCDDQNIDDYIKAICADAYVKRDSNDHETECTEGFIKECKTLEQWIKEGKYRNRKACVQATNLCV